MMIYSNHGYQYGGIKKVCVGRMNFFGTVVVEPDPCDAIFPLGSEIKIWSCNGSGNHPKPAGTYLWNNNAAIFNCAMTLQLRAGTSTATTKRFRGFPDHPLPNDENGDSAICDLSCISSTYEMAETGKERINYFFFSEGNRQP